MSVLALVFLTSFIAAFFLVPFIIRYSQRKNLLVVPDKRRIHKRITPSLGGAAIFLGFLIASIIWIDVTRWSYSFLLLTILVIPFVIGVLDDLTHLKPSVKLTAQFVTATLIYFFLDIRITSFYGSFFDTEFPLAVSYAITIVTVIIVTNSFNLIDGIDGLAGLFSFVALVFFGVWFYYAGNLNYAIISFALSGSIFSFLIYNWAPSKIFMGDTGSLVIGTMLAVLAIEFLNENDRLPADTPVKFESSIATAFCILIIPLVDTLRIIIIRLNKRVSPFKADKRHIHHALIRIGLSHRQAALILCFTHLFFLGIAILLRNFGDGFVLTVVVVLAIALCMILDRLLFKHAFRKS